MNRPAKLTPMMQQYLEIKEKNQDSILFYRMGDFYEMFFDDAKIASKILSITLTSRNNKSDGPKVPMCGIPYHAAQTYIAKLVRAGHRVAICEQTEDPAQAKGIVRREVIQTISPGVVIDGQLLDDKSNNFVAALSRKESGGKEEFGLSFLDLSTGQFLVAEYTEPTGTYDSVMDQLARLTPAELLIDENDTDDLGYLLDILSTFLPELRVTNRDESFFHLPACKDLLLDHFNVVNLNGFGCEDMNLGIICAGVLLDYAKEMQQAAINHIEKLTPIDLGSVAY